MARIVTPRNIQEIKLYQKEYKKFRGVDFAADPTQVSDNRSPICQNIVSDYAGFPEKRAGWRVLHTLNGKINGMIYATIGGINTYLVHAGTVLYTWADKTAPAAIYNQMNDARSIAFAHDSKLYILDGANYLVCSYNNGYAVEPVSNKAFIPTTVIGAASGGGGKAFEAVNLLTGKRKNSLIGDAVSIVYHLDSKDVQSIDSVLVESELYIKTSTWSHDKPTLKFSVPSIPIGAQFYLLVANLKYLAVDAAGAAIAPNTLAVGGVFSCELTKEKIGEYYKAILNDGLTAPTVTATLTSDTFTLISKEYVCDVSAGTVTFALPPSQYTGGAGIDNIVIQYTKPVSGYTDKISKCTITTAFGYYNANRMFFSGNPDYPNVDWQSGLDDPTYFPDTGYTNIGSDSTKIMGYIKQHDTLAIVKSDSETDAEIFLRTAEMTDSGSVIFPVKQGVKGIGAIAKYSFCNLRDDPLFLTRQGVYALTSTTVQQERSLQDRSYFVNSKLTKEQNLSEAVSTIWNGCYILAINDRCYVADGQQQFALSNTEEYGYEWYYWTNIPARTFLEKDGMLYFGTAEGKLCKFNTDLTKNQHNDNDMAIDAIWSTKYDDFGIFMRRKTMVKKGCGVLIKPYVRSSIDVYVATEADYEKLIKRAVIDILDFSDIDFSRISFTTKDAPQVVPFNSKVKKFIFLQIIFKNSVKNEAFGIYGTEIQYAIGNYVK